MIKIGELSNITNVSIQTIRYYESEGLIKPIEVDRWTNYRYYDKNSIIRLCEIKYLKELGFSLKEIKNLSDESIKEKISQVKFNIKKLTENIEKLSTIRRERGCVKVNMFINDEKVIGKWNKIGTVKNKEDYKSNKFDEENIFDYKELYFLPNGEEYWVFSWTKGYLKIIDTYHPYEIVNDILIIGVVDVNGVIGKKVKFKKIDNKEYSIDNIRQADDVTYEFVNDGTALGIWKSIAFTYSDDIGEVIKDKKDDLFLQRLIFCKDGKLIEENKNIISNHLLWTKGKVIDNKYSMTSSKYEILKIDNVEYLIYEWKSGDYTFGRRKPGKYILVKE